MAQPTQSSVHVDAVLTNMSVAYIQGTDMFVGTSVFPTINVQKQSDVYYTYPKGAWFRDEAKQRADGTESAGSGYTVSTDSYSAKVYSIHKDVGDQVRANSDAPLSPDRDATMFVTQRLMLQQEVQWAADYFVTGVWGTSTTPTNLWSTYETSTPVSDIETGKTTILQNTGFLPNTLVLGYNTYTSLIHHPDIIDRVQGGATTGAPATANEQLLARIFGLSSVKVCKAVKNTGLEGETDSFGFVQGKHALLCYVNPNPGLLAPSAGYTFQWTGISDGLGTNIGIKRIRMDHLNADRIEGQIAYGNKLVATDLGYMFVSVVA